MVNPNPPKPLIIRTGDNLNSSAVSGNQWYLNGNLITGAIAQTYHALVKGNYTVLSSNNFNCSTLSDLFSFIPSGLNQQLRQPGLQIYPNPNNGTFKIHSDLKIESLEISDISGRIFYQTNSPFYETTIELMEEIPSAMYFVKTVSDGTASIHRVVVIR